MADYYHCCVCDHTFADMDVVLYHKSRGCDASSYSLSESAKEIGQELNKNDPMEETLSMIDDLLLRNLSSAEMLESAMVAERVSSNLCMTVYHVKNAVNSCITRKEEREQAVKKHHLLSKREKRVSTIIASEEIRLMNLNAIVQARDEAASAMESEMYALSAIRSALDNNRRLWEYAFGVEEEETSIVVAALNSIRKRSENRNVHTDLLLNIHHILATRETIFEKLQQVVKRSYSQITEIVNKSERLLENKIAKYRSHAASTLATEEELPSTDPVQETDDNAKSNESAEHLSGTNDEMPEN